MNSLDIEITLELACHGQYVDALGAVAFGPGRFARTAFRLREGVAPEKDRSYVALKHGRVVGSVRLTRIMIASRQAMVLGPLVVDPAHKNLGIGGKLVRTCMATSKRLGDDLIILVGDAPYYKPFGFKIIPAGQIGLPGPVDPQRLLYCELQVGALQNYRGIAQPLGSAVDNVVDGIKTEGR